MQTELLQDNVSSPNSIGVLNKLGQKSSVYFLEGTKLAVALGSGMAINEYLNKFDSNFLNGSITRAKPISNLATPDGEIASVATAAVVTDSKTTLSLATTVDDTMSFGEAFQIARTEVGSNGVFTYQGNLYATLVKEEFDALSPAQKADYAESLQTLASNSNLDSSTGDQPEVEEETPSIENASASANEEITLENTESNATAPISSVETPFATPIQELVKKVEAIDKNKDGVADGLLTNTDADAEAEIIFDFSDGKAVFAFVDSNNDGIIEHLYKVAENGDLAFIAELEEPFPAPMLGTLKMQYRDLNRDGVLESRLIETDGDLVANRLDFDIANDGTFAKAYIDTDGNGKFDLVADIVKNEEGEQLINPIKLEEEILAPQLIAYAESNDLETPSREIAVVESELLVEQNEVVSLTEDVSGTEIEGMDNEANATEFMAF